MYTKPVITIPPKAALPVHEQYTVIFLHGLGDSGQGWSFISRMAREDSRLDGFSFIFPSAPDIALTVNFGMVMPAWYDLKSLGDVHTNEDTEAIKQSAAYVTLLVHAEIRRGVPLSHVIVGGFSQGCALSLLLATTLGHSLGGFIGLSGYIPLVDTITKVLQRDPEVVAANRPTPIFLAHGEKDNAIKFALARQSQQWLHSWGFANVTYREYPGLSHNTNDQEIGDVLEWLAQIGRGKEGSLSV